MGEPAEVLGPIGELKAHALFYAERGLEVFPLLPDKAPRTKDGFKNGTTDIDQIEAWWTAHPGDLIGHRIAAHHVILDIDPRHGGDKTWAAIREECGGSWPVTRGHRSGRGDGGGHTWWLRPDDKLTSVKLDTFARERGTGHAVLDNTGKPILSGGVERWTSGIDILHHTLRYTILPPSPHPDTGAPYTWIDGKGLEVAPAPMPAFLADLITSDPAPTRPSLPSTPDPTSIADWYSEHHQVGDLLAQAGWQLVAGDGRQDGSRWRHPTASSSCSATIRYGCLFVYSPNTPFEVTAPGDSHGYTPFRAYTILQHGGDASAAARAAREMKDGPTPGRINLDDLIKKYDVAPDLHLIAPAAPSSACTVDLDEPTNPANLPDEFWESSPILEHIRTAARSRLVSPDAVFGSCLTRIAAIAPHSIELPNIIGNPCGLTMYAVLVGPPESGKSAAANLAATLIPAPKNIPDRLPAGSGEGFVEALYEYVVEDDGTGKKIKVRKQTKYGAIFHIDEGEVLTDLAGRKGSTLMTTLRTAWTHGKLGSTNASAETKREIGGHLYTYGVTMGLQPAKAGPLLGDAAGGTPQRFVWFMAIDPGASRERVPWPGPLPWVAPTSADLESYKQEREIERGFHWGRHPLVLTDAIEAEVWEHRWETASGTVVRDEDEAHWMLSRLKVASLLALLIHPKVLLVDDDVWELARMVMEVSSTIRRQVQGSVADIERRKEEANVGRQVRAVLTTDDARTRQALASAAGSVARAVFKHHHGGRHDGGCTKRCLTQAIAGKHRELVGAEAIVAEAERLGWVRAEGDYWLPGESRPA